MSIFEDTAPSSPRRRPLRVAILGCSGSVGGQALDVCRQHGDKLDVVALSVNVSTDKLVAAAREFGASHVAVADESHRNDPILSELPEGCEVGFGEGAVTELADLPEVDCVFVAVVGAVGIGASYEALMADKVLACANKESLVVGGELLMPLAKPGRLVPVDSEHSAIYQCLVGERRSDVHCVWLTCSGGPFYGMTRDQLEHVTVADAMAHPNWSMGPKITIDSADLMNKGLEAIEAHHLFDVPIDDVRVLIQRQSRIHSMVEFIDGAVIAQLGCADMRDPIQYSLSYPERWDTPAARVDFLHEPPLTFGEPDAESFRCLGLAYEAGRVGGTLPCAMSAANEVANQAFIDGACSLVDIDRIVEGVMAGTVVEAVESLGQLDDVDGDARRRAREALARVVR